MIEKNSLEIKWAFTKEEKYAVQWFNNNGFVIESVKQFIGHTIFVVSKNEITDKVIVPKGCPRMKMKDFMAQFEKSFALRCEIEKPKERAN